MNDTNNSASASVAASAHSSSAQDANSNYEFRPISAGYENDDLLNILEDPQAGNVVMKVIEDLYDYGKELEPISERESLNPGEVPRVKALMDKIVYARNFLENRWGINIAQVPTESEMNAMRNVRSAVVIGIRTSLDDRTIVNRFYGRSNQTEGMRDDETAAATGADNNSNDRELKDRNSDKRSKEKDKRKSRKDRSEHKRR